MSADEFLAYHILSIEGNKKVTSAKELLYEHVKRAKDVHILNEDCDPQCNIE